jgi:hypothetical protein
MLTIDPANRALYLHYVEERESVRRKRAAGAPPPWTDDQIIAEHRFTNNRREDDRVTMWVAQNWREPHRAEPDVWFAMAVAVLVNLPPTLGELGFPAPWNRQHFLEALHRRADRGERAWGNAYTIPGGAAGKGSKPEHIAGVLTALWAAREQLRPTDGTTCEAFHIKLQACEGLGSFFAGQIVAYTKHVGPLRAAGDFDAFVCSGPGSKIGLNRIYGRAPNAPWSEAAWRHYFRAFRIAVMPELERIGLGDLSAQDQQNTLCEFSKYAKAHTDRGRLKRRFAPSMEARA